MKKLLLILSCAASAVFAAEESLSAIKGQVIFLEKKVTTLENILQEIPRCKSSHLTSSALMERSNHMLETINAIQETKALLKEKEQILKNIIENTEREGRIETLKRDINRLEWELIIEEEEKFTKEVLYQKETEDSVISLGILSIQIPTQSKKKEMLMNKQEELAQLLNSNQ